jgi:predicted 2-oxoglutarate/Fe(II)-dependent dioxygenase YbiX
MSEFRTFPSEEELESWAAKTPAFMRPCRVPFAVIIEGLLSDEQCDSIQEKLSKLETYAFNGCAAKTREIESDPVLDPIERAARFLNTLYWQYDLDEGQHSWMQTYNSGDRYQKHVDGAPGQMRKLTAVALLSESTDYEGGDLHILVHPRTMSIPRTRGTVVAFQPWIEHVVTPVTSGTRQTINMGFWGPNFR